MSKTKADLALAALRELNIVPLGQDASAEDLLKVEDIYSYKLTELEDQELAYWPEDVIPEVVFRIMTRLIAREIAPSYQFAYDDRDSKGYTSEDNLAAHTASRFSDEPVVALYF